MQKLHNAHPVELALLVALAVVEAIAVLVVALVALLLTLARWRPAAPAPHAVSAGSPVPPVTPSPERVTPSIPLPGEAPSPEPVSQPLEALTVAQLRTLARRAGLPRALSRTGRRAALLSALDGLEVAACS